MEKYSKTGILDKYSVFKNNGEPVDPDAEYFVLRLDEHAKDQKHVKACRAAIEVYAKGVADHLPELSKELLDKYGRGHVGSEITTTGDYTEATIEQVFRAAQIQMSDELLIRTVEKAISDLARSGGASHKMCVPPRITDTDMILSEMLRRFELVLKNKNEKEGEK